jgi:hypothetical protein
VSNRDDRRVAVSRGPGTTRVEIRPLVRGPRAALLLALAVATVLAAALFGGARLAQVWESSLRAGAFSDLPLPVLTLLTLTVGLSTPFALLGLAALAFSEEEVVVDRDSVTVATTAFERTRVARVPLSQLDGWRETWRPLSPWWTWTVRRLAAVERGGRLLPLAAMAGPREKREIALALARATGMKLTDPFGRVVAQAPEPSPPVLTR